VSYASPKSTDLFVGYVDLPRLAFRQLMTRHRVGLRDSILGAIVMHRQSADDDHALIRFDPQATARI
jgi:hypothetical protein